MLDADPTNHAADLPPAAARLRSGTAARLAGLPVTTLRVWERRYGVVAPAKTVTGQRLYSAHDVQRLKLLRRLSDGGHAIGTIATLALEPLLALAASLPIAAAAHSAVQARRTHRAQAPENTPQPGVTEPAAIRQVSVVGRSVARKLRSMPGIALRAVHDDLGGAESDGESTDAVDVLLVHLPSLQPASAERALALGAALHAGAVVVLYAFGAEAVAASLRAAGATLCREPVSGLELAQVIAGARSAPAPGSAGATVAARRFSDEALADLAERPTEIACECPRHLAEIVMQLVSFEHYSDDCGSRSPADAALHRHLSSLAGAARTLFEQALERVVGENRAKSRAAVG